MQIIAIHNKDIIRFCIKQDIPNEVTQIDSVKISINDVSLCLFDKYGNYVRGDQVRKNVLYYTGVSIEPTGLTVLSSNLCKTSYIYNDISVIENINSKKKTNSIEKKGVDVSA